MRWAVLFLPLVTTAVAQPTEPTPSPTPPVDPKISLEASIVGNRHEFHIGEIIPIRLAFKSRVAKRYRLNEAQYDRSGRMNYEKFTVAPADGAIDPLDTYFNSGLMFMGGGLTNFSFLKQKPWSIQLDLNEWLRFTKPGEYKLKVFSERVEGVDATSPYGTRPLTARSNEISLKILPVDHTWEKQAYDKALATLRAASPRDFDDHESPAFHALDVLRYLGTADAARELAKQIDGKRAADSVCYFGLVASPARAVAQEALEHASSDPDRPLSDSLLDAISWFERGEGKHDQDDAEKEERRFLEKLVRALPNKHGDAFRVSLYNVLDRALTHDPPLLPREIIQKLVAQLIPMFDQLPIEEQQAFLGWRWEAIKSPALMPSLKRYAETDLSKVRREDYANALWRTSWALRRWYELDPAGARPAIIREITRPHPLFGANTLGILPDKTLPEVDQALAKNFSSADGGFPELSALIARYASGAILPEVLKYVDRHIDSECGVPNGILAYILRVDPAAAKPRIEKTMAAYRKNYSRCMRATLSEIAAIHYDPVLEEIAIHALDNPDAGPSDAATMLGKFGSPAAEAALWKRYEKWSKRWTGHERELNVTLADDLDNDRVAELGFGKSLFEALATGQSWLMDQAALRRLGGSNKVPSIVEQAKRYIERWDRQPLTLRVSCSDPVGFDAGVAQYDCHSMNALKQKLSQFPSGTKFILWWPSVEKEDQSCIADIRAFLTEHGMSLEEEKKPTGD